MLGPASTHYSISPGPQNEEHTHILSHFTDGEIGVQSCEATTQATMKLMAEVQSEALFADLRLSQGYSWEVGERVLLAREGAC